MKKLIILNKKEGETPLEALEAFRGKHPKYEKLPMTYAGRLDPMASGVLIVLAGEKTKEKEKYLNLDKEYEFEVLFGFATDTYDILGLVGKSEPVKITEGELRRQILAELKFVCGSFTQTYPPYSSKTVKGKPLFQYAREGEEVELPTREVKVKSLKLLKIRKVSGSILWKNIEKRINKVNGDFRQEEILESWRSRLAGEPAAPYFRIATFTIKCGSGTYVRSIANGLGEKINIPALAYSIKRTKVGKYKIE